MRLLVVLAGLVGSALLAAEDKDAKPIAPAEAIKKVNEKVYVEMTVKASKNALAKRQEIYLDSEEDFRDPKNLAAVVTKAGADLYQQAGVADPAAHFKGKTIRVKGTVILREERPRIEVSDPKQIEAVTK